MSDSIEDMKAMKSVKQERRAQNRHQSAQLLLDEGIVFTERNAGAHLIVEGATGFIDFWPGTGKWKPRNGAMSFGVRNLIQYIKQGAKA